MATFYDDTLKSGSRNKSWRDMAGRLFQRYLATRQIDADRRIAAYLLRLDHADRERFGFNKTRMAALLRKTCWTDVSR